MSNFFSRLTPYSDAITGTIRVDFSVIDQLLIRYYTSVIEKIYINKMEYHNLHGALRFLRDH